MNYIRIDRDNMVNGPGIRTVLWVSGCEHYCKGCHNPETWSFTAGQPFTSKEAAYIASTLEKDYIAGLTISGGDPLNCHNIADVVTLCKELKTRFPEKNIWVYTGGSFEEYLKSTPETVYHDILKYIDVIVDGEFVETLKEPGLKWKGSSNQRTIDVQKSLEFNNIALFDS